MTNNDLIKSAISISGDQPPLSGNDYTVRAFTLLALIYNQCAPLDNAYREANGLPAGSWIPNTDIGSLDGDFPLADVFLAPVPYALASLLVIDEDAELSKLFYTRYVAGLAEIRRMIPASIEPIADHYHLIG